jgi:hypothetical protein
MKIYMNYAFDDTDTSHRQCLACQCFLGWLITHESQQARASGFIGQLLSR